MLFDNSNCRSFFALCCFEIKARKEERVYVGLCCSRVQLIMEEKFRQMALEAAEQRAINAPHAALLHFCAGTVQNSTTHRGLTFSPQST